MDHAEQYGGLTFSIAVLASDSTCGDVFVGCSRVQLAVLLRQKRRVPPNTWSGSRRRVIFQARTPKRAWCTLSTQAHSPRQWHDYYQYEHRHIVIIVVIITTITFSELLAGDRNVTDAEQDPVWRLVSSNLLKRHFLCNVGQGEGLLELPLLARRSTLGAAPVL